MTIGIVDVGLSNLGSLRHAVHCQGWDSVLVRSPSDFSGISHLLLPGVGAFATAMGRLDEAGLSESIRQFSNRGRPVLGICLGMQLLAQWGTEGGQTQGLGLLPGKVELIQPTEGLRIPHVGWNEVRHTQAHPLLKGIRSDIDFYFVHSYRFSTTKMDIIFSMTQHGEHFPTVVGQRNVVGVQFHPEKSQKNGLRLLDNFCLWGGVC